MKRILKFSLCIVLMLVSIIFIYYHYKTTEVVDTDNEVLSDQSGDIVSSLISQYNNKDIVAKLVIPGILEVPVVKGIDNDYYVNHDLYNDINDQGAIYLDYRNKFSDRKLLIYGHNNNPKTLIFNDLLNYKDEDFFIKHPKIYLYTLNDVRVYDIFSIYEENNDFSYSNINSFNGYTYYDHLKELKANSIFESDIDITGNSRVLVLDTNVVDSNNSVSHFLVIGAEE